MLQALVEVLIFCWLQCLLVGIALGVWEMLNRAKQRRLRRWHRRPHTCDPGFAGLVAETTEELDALYDASH